jgi:hypothetical protein
VLRLGIVLAGAEGCWDRQGQQRVGAVRGWVGAARAARGAGYVICNGRGCWRRGSRQGAWVDKQ